MMRKPFKIDSMKPGMSVKIVNRKTMKKYVGKVMMVKFKIGARAIYGKNAVDGILITTADGENLYIDTQDQKSYWAI